MLQVANGIFEDIVTFILTGRKVGKIVDCEALH
jgi:hypothetical protein